MGGWSGDTAGTPPHPAQPQTGTWVTCREHGARRTGTATAAPRHPCTPDGCPHTCLPRRSSTPRPAPLRTLPALSASPRVPPLRPPHWVLRASGQRGGTLADVARSLTVAARGVTPLGRAAGRVVLVGRAGDRPGVPPSAPAFSYSGARRSSCLPNGSLARKAGHRRHVPVPAPRPWQVPGGLGRAAVVSCGPGGGLRSGRAEAFPAAGCGR